MKTLDAPAIERIISATGHAANIVDRKQLAFDLEMHWLLLRSIRTVHSPTVARRTLRELKLLASAAAHLKARLNGTSKLAKIKLVAAAREVSKEESTRSAQGTRDLHGGVPVPEACYLDADICRTDPAFKWQLNRLLVAADRAIKDHNRGSEEGVSVEGETTKGSTFESFVGEELAAIYRKHFGRKPTFRRNTKRPFRKGLSGWSRM